MNKFVFGILLISITAGAVEKGPGVTQDQTYVCVVTNEDRKFDDVFIADLKVNGPSTLSYQRRTNKGWSQPQMVPRCGNMIAQPSDHRPEVINLECEDDGEQGFFEVSPDTGLGEVYFYMPKLGYGERTGLELSCTEK